MQDVTHGNHRNKASCVDKDVENSTVKHVLFLWQKLPPSFISGGRRDYHSKCWRTDPRISGQMSRLNIVAVVEGIWEESCHYTRNTAMLVTLLLLCRAYSTSGFLRAYAQRYWAEVGNGFNGKTATLTSNALALFFRLVDDRTNDISPLVSQNTTNTPRAPPSPPKSPCVPAYHKHPTSPPASKYLHT